MPTLSLKAFLSHRYQSPAVNMYFHDVFNDVAELQFDVDVGTGATNVTRLERMIREADGFVGIYPYDADGFDRPTRDQLLQASRYFRLELELAARARQPAIVFVDERYGPTLHAAAGMFVCSFDHQEVTGSGGSPKRDVFRRAFQNFCENVQASMQYELTRPQLDKRLVGILLPSDVYDADVVTALQSQLSDHNVESEVLPWSSVLDAGIVGRLQAYDWIVTEVGAAAAPTGFAGYLHGQFVPMLRLVHQSDSQAAQSPSELERSLYGAHQVGYAKDIVRWTTSTQLSLEFGKRLLRVLQGNRRIGSIDSAREYFREAALRKEAVFVSYSGRDEAAVAPIAQALRRRFQSVFDYRDGGESIQPGQPWLEEIFSKLDRSAIAIPMLSSSYLASGNCIHEARNIVAARDSGKIKLLPVKLAKEDLALPSFLTDTQYLRVLDYANAEALVDQIVKAFDR